MLAARRGKFDVCKLLLDCGANISTKAYNGKRPLQWACEHGHADVACLFLDRGAIINEICPRETEDLFSYEGKDSPDAMLSLLMAQARNIADGGTGIV
jgi:ankyrin repeat protein